MGVGSGGWGVLGIRSWGAQALDLRKDGSGEKLYVASGRRTPGTQAWGRQAKRG